MAKHHLFLLIILIVLQSCGTMSQAVEFPDDPVLAFTQLEQAIDSTTDPQQQQQLINIFLEKFPHTPLISGENVVFLYQSDARRVSLTGDMTNWLQTIPMQRLGATNTWALTQTFPLTARLDYRFGIGGGGGIQTDPLNPRTIPGGFGLSSELRMPEYMPPAEVEAQADIPQGTLEDLGLYRSTISSTTHELVVYLPPGYDPNAAYPSVYFQDGDDYRRFANAPTIFDNAIASGKLPPLIGVFVTPSEEQGRQADYDLNPAYAEFFASELVELIDSRYATIDDPRSRVVVGDSYGGLISLYIGFVYPDVFGGVVNHSGFVSRYSDRLISLFASQQIPSLRIDTVVGSYETCVGGVVLGADCNFTEGNRLLHQVLEANGYTHRFNEYPQGHSWGFWRDYIDENIAWALDWHN